MIRPHTAPHHNYESLQHKSKINSENPCLPITDGTSITMNHRESFQEKQDIKHRKRCEIYAINAVMKAAFEREFECQTSIGKGQTP